MKTETEYRQDIIEIGKRVYQKGFVASNDGNISVRISDNEVIATPTGRSKGFLTTDQLVKVNLDGEKLEGYLEPSSEIKFHLRVYQLRPDVRSVVHAHPPVCTAYAVAGIPLDKPVLPEAVVSLGCIPIARYGTPGTEELVSTIAEIIPRCDAILLENHGALSVGPDIYSAYYKMETMEHFAHIIWIATTLGRVNLIEGENLEKLFELRKRFGLAEKPLCDVCTVPLEQIAQSPSVVPGNTAPNSGNDDIADIVSRVTAKVIEALKE